MKYGVHKLWFGYNDEWIFTEDVLASQVATFNTLEEAEKTKKREDVRALRALSSPDYIRELTGFMENDNLEEKIDLIVEFAKRNGWHDELNEEKIGNTDEVYYELAMPSDATDEQLEELLEITGAYFNKIVEYKNVKKLGYIKFNHKFWGSKVFKEFKEQGIIENRNPYIDGSSERGKYFVQKPAKGRKSATLRELDIAISRVIELSMRHIDQYYEYCHLGKIYFDELSYSTNTLVTYIEGCSNIELKQEIITKDNIGAYQRKIKKLKSNLVLSEGDEFRSIEFKNLDDLKVKELQGFFDLLIVKPFDLYEMYAEINGDKVVNYSFERQTW